MNTMCSPVYYSGFVAIDALGHMLPDCMSFHRTTHCGDNQACTLFP